jgi:hypothetical protein
MALISGDGGDNTIGTNGSDLIFGQGGNDTLTSGNSSASLFGGEGNDKLVSGSGGGLIDGGEGDDLLIGGGGDVTIVTGSGNNTVEVGGGNTTVVLGSGNNTVNAADSSGDLIITGEGGNNTITLGDGSAVVQLGDGNDIIIGGSGDATINGGEGDDTIVLGGGNYEATGGGGSDTYVFGPETSGDVTLSDFDPTKDTIDLSTFPAPPVITGDGADGTTITLGGITIQVPGVAPEEVEQATNFNPDAPCFLRGSMILTTVGEVAVEDLKIGDMVVTLDGTAKPVKWIGRRGHSARFISRVPTIEPVCFTAGSLGENLPSRDLYVSHDHAMFFDGVFIDAARLVNGTTVLRKAPPQVRMIEYFHVEFDAHEVIFSNGVTSESYANHGNRSMFQNAAEYDTLYATDTVAKALPFNCHERRYQAVYSGQRLFAVREKLAARAAELAAAERAVALSA